MMTIAFMYDNAKNGHIKQLVNQICWYLASKFGEARYYDLINQTVTKQDLCAGEKLVAIV